VGNDSLVAARGTETLRARPEPRDAAPTISTTQELPPPPPGRWERVWDRMRTSPLTRAALIVVAVVAVVVAGVTVGRGEGSGTLTTTRPETPSPDADALEQWRNTAVPVLTEIEATNAGIADAALSGEPAAIVARCQEASGRVAGWAQTLAAAPHPELDAEVRTKLDALARAYAGCALTS